jgi:hypothetical protein
MRPPLSSTPTSIPLSFDSVKISVNVRQWPSRTPSHAQWFGQFTTGHQPPNGTAADPKNGCHRLNIVKLMLDTNSDVLTGDIGSAIHLSLLN